MDLSDDFVCSWQFHFFHVILLLRLKQLCIDEGCEIGVEMTVFWWRLWNRGQNNCALMEAVDRGWSLMAYDYIDGEGEQMEHGLSFPIF